MKTWLVTLALFLACAAPAHAYVYWTDGGQGTIGRANLDGSGVKRDFITGATAPRGIAVDENHIYWTTGGAIGRADLDGSDVDQGFITGADSPIGLAVDGSFLYWTTSSGIGRASLDGSPVNHSFITVAAAPYGLAVNDLGIYWSDAADRIRRADLDGSSVETVSIDADDLGLAVDANRIVWAYDSPARFLIGDLGAGGAIGNVRSQLLAAPPRSVGLDAERFYWTMGGAIGRINRDGTGIDEDFIASVDPWMLALDDGQSGTASRSPESLSFGSETVGALGAVRTLTVTNTGPGDLEIDLARITGTHTDDFLLGGDTCSGTVRKLDETCTVSVVFLPDAIGDRRATLTITSNDPKSPLEIPLQGTGEDPNPPGSFDDDDFGFDDDFDEDEEESEETPDRPRLVTCRIVEVRANGRRVERRRCRNRRLRGSPNFSTLGAAHATLTRRKTVYGTGTARRSRVVLDLHRRVEPGRYTLTLRAGGEVVRRARIRILKDR